ncbi:MAG: helix-turn-helix domain-containing protein [Anaerovoracaceae bacterium]
MCRRGLHKGSHPHIRQYADRQIQAARALGISKATLYRRIKEIQEQGGNI